MIKLFYALINSVISLLGGIIGIVLDLLPNSPFTWDLSSIDNSYLKMFLWIVPVQEIASFLSLYITAVSAYYLIRVVLRWLKVAGE